MDTSSNAGRAKFYKDVYRDAKFEHAADKRKYPLLWDCAAWSSGVFIAILALSFWLSGFYVNENDIFIVQGMGELFWFSLIGGLFIGGLAKGISMTNYLHPDTDVKDKSTIKNVIATEMDEGEEYKRGVLMTNGPNERVIEQCYKSGKKAADTIRKHIHANLPEREKAIVFGDVVPATMLAGAPYPYSLENRALFCIGSAGSGKSQIIKELIYGVRKRGGRDKFVFYDRKPEYLPMFYREGDVVLCPADLRHRNWDMFAEIEGEQDIDGVIKSLIPPGSGDTKDKFWIDSARAVFRGVIVWLLNAQREAYERGETPFEKPSNEELVKFLAQTSSDPLKLWNVLKTRPDTAFIASCLNCAERPQSGTANSIIASLTSYTLSFTRPEVAERGNFSMREWLRSDKTEGQAVFLANPAKYGDNYESYFTMILNLALSEMISLPNDNDRRVWFIIDEFGSLMRLGSVIRLLAEGRSKGACTIIGTQDIAQMKEKYKDEHKTIINNCNSQCIARVTDHDEAKYLSDMIGEVEVSKEDSGNNVSLDSGSGKLTANISDKENAAKREKRNVVLPSEISSMPDLTYLVKPSDLGWFKNKIDYYPWGKHDIVLPFIQRPSYYFNTMRTLENTPSFIASVIESADPNKQQQGGSRRYGYK